MTKEEEYYHEMELAEAAELAKERPDLYLFNRNVDCTDCGSDDLTNKHQRCMSCQFELQAEVEAAEKAAGWSARP